MMSWFVVFILFIQFVFCRSAAADVEIRYLNDLNNAMVLGIFGVFTSMALPAVFITIVLLSLVIFAGYPLFGKRSFPGKSFSTLSKFSTDERRFLENLNNAVMNAIEFWKGRK